MTNMKVAKPRSAKRRSDPDQPPAPETSRWRNRIVGEGIEAPEQLLANPANFRRHPKEQQQALAGVLSEVGWVQKVIVNKRTGFVLDGHARIELALREGETGVPVVYVDLSEDEERLMLSTLDPIGAMAFSDNDALQQLLGGIRNTSTDLQPLLDSLAKSAKGIEELTKTGNTDDDKAPAPRAKAISKVGELWILGDHRLVVGDATDPKSVDRLMSDGSVADLVLTDPPYNIAYETSAGKIDNDNLSNESFRAFLKALFTAAARACRPGTGFYVFHADTETIAFRQMLEAAGFGIRQVLIWAKTSATLSRSDYNWRHEPIAYGWLPGAAHYFAYNYTETTVIDQADRISEMKRADLEAFTRALITKEATTSVIYEPKPSRSVEHPTMKPVDLLVRLMANSSRRGDVVFDPCGGSGSTMIAAAKIGRAARLIELDPVYADVILRRWEEWSGEDAMLGDKTFTEISSARS